MLSKLLFWQNDIKLDNSQCVCCLSNAFGMSPKSIQCLIKKQLKRKMQVKFIYIFNKHKNVLLTNIKVGLIWPWAHMD